MPELSFAEVAEGVRATIARYTHALDDGRTDDVVATFCPDGTFELSGTGGFTGHQELRSTYAGWVPRSPQRHLVTNTEVTDWNDDEAHALSDVVLLAADHAGWSVVFVARYHDVLHRVDDVWLFHHRSVTPTS